MAIDQSNVYGSTVTTILGYFRDASNGLTDTHSPARARSSWILPSFPTEDSDGRRLTNSSFPDYPLVIVSSPDVSSNIHTLSKKQRMGSIVISVLHRGNIADLDSISKEVINNLETNESNLRTAGVVNPQIDSSPVTTSNIDNRKYHQRDITLSFIYRELI